MPTSSAIAGNDAWLWKILQKEKNREMAAILENSLHSFVMDEHQSSLTFPSPSAFHRRVCFAVARRYGLQHRLKSTATAHQNDTSASAASVKQNDDEIEDEVAPSYNQSKPSTSDKELMRLVLIKTPHSAPPATRLDQFANGPQPPSTPCLPPSSSSSSSTTAPPPSTSLPCFNSINTINSNSSSPSTSSDFNNLAIPQLTTNNNYNNNNNNSNSNNHDYGNTIINNPSLSVDDIGLNNPGNSNAEMQSMKNIQSASTSSLTPIQTSRPATFLRRPRTADGKLKKTANGSSILSNSSPNVSTPHKNFTAEDYQKMRARIFKDPDGTSNDITSESSNTNSAVNYSYNNESSSNGSAHQDYAAKGSIAKGPVEGSRGFERRRNRRNIMNINNNGINDVDNNNSMINSNSNSSSVNNISNDTPINQSNNNNQNKISSSIAQQQGNTGSKPIGQSMSSSEFDNVNSTNITEGHNSIQQLKVFNNNNNSSSSNINNNSNNNYNNGRTGLNRNRNSINHLQNSSSNGTRGPVKDSIKNGHGCNSFNDNVNEIKNVRNNGRNSKHVNQNYSNKNGNTMGNGVVNPVDNGRKYSSESNLGDLKDPDFDRSYVKWARREPINGNMLNPSLSSGNIATSAANMIGANNGNVGTSIGMNMFHAPHVMYAPYATAPNVPNGGTPVTTQAINQHAYPHLHVHHHPSHSHHHLHAHPHMLPPHSHAYYASVPNSHPAPPPPPPPPPTSSNPLQQLQQHPLAVAASAAAMQSVQASMGVHRAPGPSPFHHHPPGATMVTQQSPSPYPSAGFANGKLPPTPTQTQPQPSQPPLPTPTPPPLPPPAQQQREYESVASHSLHDMISMASDMNIGSAHVANAATAQPSTLSPHPHPIAQQHQQHQQQQQHPEPYQNAPVVHQANADLPAATHADELQGVVQIEQEADHATAGADKVEVERRTDVDADREQDEVRMELEVTNRDEEEEEDDDDDEKDKKSYHTREMPWAPAVMVNDENMMKKGAAGTPAYGLDSTIDFPPLG